MSSDPFASNEECSVNKAAAAFHNPPQDSPATSVSLCQDQTDGNPAAGQNHSHNAPVEYKHDATPQGELPGHLDDSAVSSATSNPAESGAKDAQKRRKGPNICLHGRVWSVCRQCGGGSICQHNRRRSVCKDCGGGGICQHGKQKTQCKACGGACVCAHGKQKSQCKDCGGGSICPHGRVRSKCKECGGGSICRHKKRRSMCVDCGGGSVCEHGKRKAMCKLCCEPSPAAASAMPASPLPPKKFSREDFLKMLLESAPCNTAAPVSSAGAAVVAPPTFHLPSAAENLTSLLAAATTFSNLELLRVLDATNAHNSLFNPNHNCSAFNLPGSMPFVHPLVAPLLLGVNPLLSQAHFDVSANLHALSYHASHNPPTFNCDT